MTGNQLFEIEEIAPKEADTHPVNPAVIQEKKASAKAGDDFSDKNQQKLIDYLNQAILASKSELEDIATEMKTLELRREEVKSYIGLLQENIKNQKKPAV